MALKPGTRLGPYEIIAPLGAGGMGEVYRARDTRLDRDVAVKVLPEHLSGNPDFRTRFEREARAASSLNHPNICTLHDVGRQEGLDFLVMELLDGETLGARLERGPLPPSEALRHAVSIADALDKAHRQGLVHRDLKPGNIMLTASGAKLMDFGLAKLAAPAGSGPTLATAAPTATTPLTAQGSIVGTFQYMAPEQLQGSEADTRSDIFAFGVILYEMVAGRRAFAGNTQATLFAAILKDEPPPLSDLQPLSPPALERLIRECLVKEPDDRRQTMHDVLLDLRWIAEGGSQAGVPAPVARKRRSRLHLAWVAAAVLGLASLVLGVALVRSLGVEVAPLRASILPPEEGIFQFTGAAAGPPALSPDGRQLAFVIVTQSGESQLWVRPLGALTARPLPGTAGARRPFWSPDSRFLGFFAGGKLKKIELSGGPPIPLCDASDDRGGTWGAGDVILFTPSSAGPVHQVSARGGTSTPVTHPADDQQTTDRYPWFLPDGEHFLFLERHAAAGAVQDPGTVRLGSLGSSDSTELLRGTSNAIYASGYLLYTRETTLMAQPFDAGRGELQGEAVPIAQDVRLDSLYSRGIFTASETGVLAYQSGGASQASMALAWFDRDGTRTGTLGDPGVYTSPRVSPDGKRVMVSMIEPGTGNIDVWMFDVARNLRTRFTFDPGLDFGAVWSPDSRRVAIGSARSGTMKLYVKRADGSGTLEEWAALDGNLLATDWSSDGRAIALDFTPAGKSDTDLWVLPTDGDRKAYPVLETSFDENSAVFSPDGRWLAYVSDESGAGEVFISSFPPGTGKWQVSSGGGGEPAWGPNGSELFHLAPDNRIMVTEILEKDGSLQVGATRPLFKTQAPDVPGSVYSLSPDGRILVDIGLEEKGSIPITLVINWLTDLDRH